MWQGRTTRSKLSEALAYGGCADFEGRRLAVDQVRAVLLGIDVPDEYARLRAVAQSRLHIKRAVFAERLALDDLAGPGGGALPGLVLDDCDFADGLTLAHSHLARLEIRNCRFAGGGEHCATIELEGAQIDGDVRVEDVGRDDERELLWIRGGNLRVDGDVDLVRCKLHAPPPRDNVPVSQLLRYALDLHGSEIGGSLRGVDDLVAIGGVNLSDSHIRGDVWIGGAYLRAGEGQAFRAQLATIDGVLILCAMGPCRDSPKKRPLRVNGSIWLLGARVGGELSMDGIRVWASEGANAISVDSATIGGSFRLETIGNVRPKIMGTISLDSATIDGSAKFGPLSWGTLSESKVLEAERLTVGADLVLKEVQPLSRRDRGVEDASALWRQRQIDDWLDQLDPPDRRFVPSDDWRKEFLESSIELGNGTFGSLILEASESGAPSCVNGGISAHNATCENECCIDGIIVGNASFAGMTIRNGSLQLQQLRLVRPEVTSKRPELDLSNLDVAKSIQVAEEIRLPLPLAVRCKPLSCLPGRSLVEARWPGDCPRMTGHVIKSELLGTDLVSRWRRRQPSAARDVATLNGEGALFYNLHASGALSVDTEAKAEEFLRLSCAYLQSGDGAVLILDTADTLAGMSIDADAARREIDQAHWQREQAIASAVADEIEQAETAVRDVERLAAMTWAQVVAAITPLRIRSEADRFVADAVVLHATRLSRVTFRVGRPSAAEPSLVELIEAETISPPLDCPIRYRGMAIVRYCDVVPDGPSATVQPPDGREWPVLQTLPGTIEVDRATAWGELLARHGPDSANLSDAVVNLEDAQCDTLNDFGGRAWGARVLLKLDRFTYRHSARYSASRSPKDEAGILRRLDTFFTHGPGSADQEAVRYRYAWLMQQFDRKRGLDSMRKCYSPQPFSQAIEVARAGGDDELAIAVEIGKRRIEGRLFAERWRPSLAIIGGVAFVAWIVTHRLDSLFDALIGVGLLLGTGFLFDLAHLSMWLMFGYLRRPVNSTLTLVGFMLLGWIGVHAANQNDRLVVATMPVASVIDSSRSGSFGSPVGTKMRSAIRCGDEINEFLYAVDLFIPLIDMHQEDRCDVGIVDGTAPAKPAGPPARWSPGDIQVQFADFRQRTIASRTFWDALKALYSIIGWIVVSLSVLTFTYNMRSGSGE